MNLLSSDDFKLDKFNILEVCFPVVKPRAMPKAMLTRLCKEESTHCCEAEGELM